MMPVPLKQSTAVTIRLGPFLDKTDGVTEETALTPAVEVSKNHGAFAARSSAGAIAHDAGGWYSVPLDATDTGTLGPLLVKSDDAANHLPVWREFVVLPANVYDALVAGSDKLDVSLVEWLGTAPLALISQRVQALAVGAGLRQITVSVVDGAAAPVPDATVAIYDSSNTTLITRGTTGAGGTLVVALDDGTYKVRLLKAGYSFTTPQTLVVSADASVQYTATQWVPSPASSPDLCMVYGTVVDAAGDPVPNAEVRAEAVVPATSSANQLGRKRVTTTANASGYFELELVRGASVLLSIPEAGIASTKTVPNLASQNLATWS
jgi:hypothetical protein